MEAHSGGHQLRAGGRIAHLPTQRDDPVSQFIRRGPIAPSTGCLPLFQERAHFRGRAGCWPFLQLTMRSKDLLPCVSRYPLLQGWEMERTQLGYGEPLTSTTLRLLSASNQGHAAPSHDPAVSSLQVHGQGCVLVNPHDIDGLATTLDTALHLPPTEQRQRMQSLRRSIKRHDVFHWAQSFLEALGT